MKSGRKKVICKQSTTFFKESNSASPFSSAYISPPLSLSPPSHFLSLSLSLSSQLKHGRRRRHQRLLFLLFVPSGAAPVVRRDQPLRRLQDPAPPLRREMRSGALFPPARSPQVHHRSPRLRRQQHNQVLAGLYK